MLGWGFFLLVACLASDGEASNLRVGTCDTAVTPYILFAEDGSLTGFEPHLWTELYKVLSDKVGEGTDEELKLLVGTTAPKVQQMPVADLKAAVISNQLDIAFCGLELTADSVFLYDHSAAFHNRALQVDPRGSQRGRRGCTKAPRCQLEDSTSARLRKCRDYYAGLVGHADGLKVEG